MPLAARPCRPSPRYQTSLQVCHRSGKPVYAADNPVRIGGMVFNPTTFTC